MIWSSIHCSYLSFLTLSLQLKFVDKKQEPHFLINHTRMLKHSSDKWHNTDCTYFLWSVVFLYTNFRVKCPYWTPDNDVSWNLVVFNSFCMDAQRVRNPWRKSWKSLKENSRNSVFFVSLLT